MSSARSIAGFEPRDARTVWNFVRTNVRDKYLGSSLGSIWGVANPLLMLAVFTFVFGYVYKVRLPGAETTLGYAIWLIAGYSAWIAIAESVMAAATSVTGAAGIVKNLAIKTELLPIAGALTGALPLAVGLLFLMVVLALDGKLPDWHLVFLPLVVALQFLLVTAIGFLLAAATVFFRDLAYALPNLLLVVLFSSPIFYPLESMPAAAQAISRFNPFYILPEAYRAILIHQRVPDLAGMLFVACVSLALGLVTLRVFRRAKGHFAAVI